MSFISRETSQYSGKPYELFLFSTVEGVWRYTGADEIKTYNSVPFTPEAITHTGASQSNEVQGGQVKITLPLTNAVAQQFIAYIPNSPMWVTIYRAHDGELDSETVVYWQGKVSQPRFGDACELTCVPEQQELKKTIPTATYGTQCNRILFDLGCTVDKTAFRQLGTLTSVVGVTIKAAAYSTKPDGFFNGGYIEFGNARRMILNHVGDTLTLIAQLPSLVIGSQVWAYAGCNHLYNGDCVTKFANGKNFFGFQWIPSNNPFVGSIT